MLYLDMTFYIFSDINFMKNPMLTGIWCFKFNLIFF